MVQSLRSAYRKRLRDGQLKADAGQEAAVTALSRLEGELKGRRGLFGFSRRNQGETAICAGTINSPSHVRPFEG